MTTLLIFLRAGHPLAVNDSDKLDAVLVCLKRMETTLAGLKELRGVLPKGASHYMVQELIADAEKAIAEIKKRIVQ